MDCIIFQLKFILNLAVILIFALSFTWRLTYAVLSLLGRSLDGSHMYFLFLGNNRQHMSICAKRISSWARKVLGVAKAHMSPSTFWGAVVSKHFELVFPLCPSCRQVTGMSFYPIVFYLHYYYRFGPGFNTTYLICWQVSNIDLCKVFDIFWAVGQIVPKVFMQY